MSLNIQSVFRFSNYLTIFNSLFLNRIQVETKQYSESVHLFHAFWFTGAQSQSGLLPTGAVGLAPGVPLSMLTFPNSVSWVAGSVLGLDQIQVQQFGTNSLHRWWHRFKSKCQAGLPFFKTLATNEGNCPRQLFKLGLTMPAVLSFHLSLAVKRNSL